MSTSLLIRSALLVIAYSLLLRLVCIGSAELLPEEAYYWLYAQHLAPGYLDHPPMVSWFVALGTRVFGNNEFGVRSGALLCWLLGGGGVFLLAHRMFGRATAFVALALFAILPYYFGAGLVMTPEAPLVASWAWALYFLHRALIAGERGAWYGVGIAVGLGMLSKYTISLLGAATLLLLLITPSQRSWLRRPEPYLCVCIAALIFSPVLYWNATHRWASFLFQSVERLQSSEHFSMHLLLLHMMALMLPSGLYAACISLWRPPAAQQFVRLFFLVPCGVFLLYSLRHVPKLNWTGPAFLALLPSMSHHLVAIASGARFQGARALQRMWGWTLPLWGLGLGCTLYYLAFGISFIPYSPTMYRALGWESLASGIGALAQRIEEQEGAPPVIVGMDTHFIASELAFYLRKAGKPYAVTSRNLLGKSSLMFRFWDSAERFHGRTVILVGQTQKELLLPGIAAYFTALGPVEEVKTEKGGFPLHTFYARVGHELKAREKDS
jgi:dolichol-phosphate mannosyltransferase